MAFAYDTENSLVAAVELANSELEPDSLTTLDDLTGFLARHRYGLASAPSRGDVEAVRGIRSNLRTLLTASRDDASVLVNTVLARAAFTPRLVRHDAVDWHMHYAADSARLHDRIMTDTAIAIADVVRADEMSRLSICADATCEGIVFDMSRNRSKRFCSVTCGNRNAVAAFRRRRSGGREGTNRRS
jgi:predicted RNA-binding Zn ribbon-like protein